MADKKRRIKTIENQNDPLAFIESVKSEVKRNDSRELAALMQDITGAPPRMWGSSIIGFGLRRYLYANGQSGEICLTGFSPRSGGLVLYLGPGIDNAKLMAKLGKHKVGKGCLYVNKLDDVDRDVLRQLIEYSVAELRKGDSS
ncbi:MAG TPA: DUF1801 domain-containing protein [Gammaproteobacteria bacterium]